MNTQVQHRPLVSEKTTDLSFKGFWRLVKPTIGFLVVVTALPCLFMTSEGLPSLGVIVAAVVGTLMASFSAGAFNQIADKDIDSMMERTKRRPIPAGKIPKHIAITFASTLGILSFYILYVFTTPLAAWIAMAGIAFYVLVYTLFLKTRTTQNIVIGGAAGSVGPLIGWAAASGTLEWPAWVLFGIMFFWTPPHFWSLAIKYKDDYSKANIPMLPSVKGVRTTKNQIFLYTLVLLPLVFSLQLGNAAGSIFTLVAGGLTLYFVYLALGLMINKKQPMNVFIFSCLYIIGIFGALIVDRFYYLLLA